MLARVHALKHFTVGQHFVGCCFIPSDTFNQYCTKHIGRASGQWVFPVTYLNHILQQWTTTGNVNDAIRTTLNFETHGNRMTLCVYKKPFHQTTVLLPQRDTPGANAEWVPGGYTASGVPEIIIPQAPVHEYSTYKEINCPTSVMRFLNNV